MKNLNGFLIINKPVGLSSFEIVRNIKKRFKITKIGHTGTLDPFASGVLVIALNRATKLIQFLDESKKEYEAELMLGIETDTDDLTGEIIQEFPVGEISLPRPGL